MSYVRMGFCCSSVSSSDFHAIYGEYEAQIVIETLEPLAGELPPRALRLVQEWTAIHRAELEANWAKARAHVPLDTIEPLP
jgi:hypothetical protein